MGGHTWPDLLATLVAGEDLPEGAAGWAMRQIMQGEALPVQVAGFLIGLQAKGVTIGELTAVADEMLAHSRPIRSGRDCLDIVGTGGDRQNTVNISTMAAIVSAAAGATIVKHGNRAASSKSGTADCLEALGIVLSLGPEGVAATADEVGMTFAFAQDFHPSMRHAAAPRRELGVPTVFNLLGPLTNPARPRFSAVGSASPVAAPLIAGVFAARGTDAAVFRGRDGLDEVTVSTETDVWWVRRGEVARFDLAPERVGLGRHPLSDLRGGEPHENAEVVRRLVAGDVDGTMQAVRDAVLINAGTALAVVHDGERTTVTDQESFESAVRAGVDRARDAVESGDAARLLDRWREVTRRLGGRS